MKRQTRRQHGTNRLLATQDVPIRFSWFRRACGAIVLGALASSALQAEHRAALLIGNTRHAGQPVLDGAAGDVRLLEAALRQRGFYTTMAADVDREGLYGAVEQFVSTAPINGTALVYFSGYLCSKPGAERGKVRLLGVGESRDGLPLIELLDWLFLHSATAQNVIVINGRFLQPQISVAQLVDSNALPGDTWLCDVGSPTKRSPSAFTSATIERDGDTLGDVLAAASQWSQSTCRARPLSGAASRAVAGPDEFPGNAAPGDEWVSSDGTIFCYCPPPAGGRGFWIGKYEVPLCKWRIPDQYGGIGVNRNDPTTHHLTKDVLARLHAQTIEQRRGGRIPNDWEFSLPSPDEWEHAARAGSAGERYFEEKDLARHANFADRTLLATGDDYYLYADPTRNDGVAKLAPVGSYLPNAWGLHDVYGNAWEQTDEGVLCGGGWTSLPESCRATVRKPALRFPADFVGLRIVLRPSVPAVK